MKLNFLLKPLYDFIKFLPIIIFFFYGGRINAITTPLEYCNPFAELSCGQVVFTLTDDEYKTLKNVPVSITIRTVTEMISFIFGNVSSTSVFYGYLDDPLYFQYLGNVVLDPAHPNQSKLHGFRLVYDYPSGSPETLTHITLLASKKNLSEMLFTTSYKKNCGQCPTCPSREAMLFIYYRTLFKIRPSLPVTVSLGENYSNLPPDIQAKVATILNWYIDNTAPAVNDYLDMLNPYNELNQTHTQADVPPVFCKPNPPEEGSNLCTGLMACKCSREFFVYLTALKDRLMQLCPPLIIPGSFTCNNNPDDEYVRILNETIFSCGCLNKYCFDLSAPFSIGGNEVGGSYELFVSPIAQGGLPTFMIKVAYEWNEDFTSFQPHAAIAYSCDYRVADFTRGIIYEGNGIFSYDLGFSEFIRP